MVYVYYKEELYHHGIRGQKWGERNGPPYPLGSGDHSAAEEKAGWRKSLENWDYNRRKKKLSKYSEKRNNNIKKADRINEDVGKIDKKIAKGSKGLLSSRMTTAELNKLKAQRGELSEKAASLREEANSMIDKGAKEYEKLINKYEDRVLTDDDLKKTGDEFKKMKEVKDVWSQMFGPQYKRKSGGTMENNDYISPNDIAYENADTFKDLFKRKDKNAAKDLEKYMKGLTEEYKLSDDEVKELHKIAKRNYRRDLAATDDLWDLDYLEYTQNDEKMSKSDRLADYTKYLTDPYKWLNNKREEQRKQAERIKELNADRTKSGSARDIADKLSSVFDSETSRNHPLSKELERTINEMADTFPFDGNMKGTKKDINRGQLEARAKALRNQGLSMAQIAKKLGYESESSVRNLLGDDTTKKKLEKMSGADFDGDRVKLGSSAHMYTQSENKTDSYNTSKAGKGNGGNQLNVDKLPEKHRDDINFGKITVKDAKKNINDYTIDELKAISSRYDAEKDIKDRYSQKYSDVLNDVYNVSNIVLKTVDNGAKILERLGVVDKDEKK